MAYWLVKEEPTHYSYMDLVREGITEWSGVHNALALQHLRSMRPGDETFFYASGTVKSIVGIMKVAGVPRPDPNDDRGSWSVKFRPVRPVDRPIPLAEIKADPAFAEFALVRISRLSILPVPAPLWKRLLRMGRSKAPVSR